MLTGFHRVPSATILGGADIAITEIVYSRHGTARTCSISRTLFALRYVARNSSALSPLPWRLDCEAHESFSRYGGYLFKNEDVHYCLPYRIAQRVYESSIQHTDDTRT